MKTGRTIWMGIVMVLLAGCNHDDNPIGVPYFSTVVVLQNDTVFTENSVESRGLYNDLHAQIAEVSRAYQCDTTIASTWGERKSAYRVNDSIAIARFITTVTQLDTVIRQGFEAEKAMVARDGSFVLRLAVLVTRDKRVAESHSINYIFNRFNQ